MQGPGRCRTQTIASDVCRSKVAVRAQAQSSFVVSHCLLVVPEMRKSISLAKISVGISRIVIHRHLVLIGRRFVLTEGVIHVSSQMMNDTAAYAKRPRGHIGAHRG